MKSGNIARIVVACKLPYTRAHFVCGFIRKSNAENIRRKNADFVYKIGKSVSQSACLARTCTGYYAHKTFCGGNSQFLFFVEFI